MSGTMIALRKAQKELKQLRGAIADIVAMFDW